MNYKPSYTISEFFQYASENQFKLVELVAEPPYCYIDDFDSKQREAIKKESNDLGLELTVHGSFSDINIAAYNPDIREASQKIVKKSIDFAAEIGASIVTVHPGEMSAGGAYYPDVVIQNNKDALILLADYAKPKEILIGYENLPLLPWNQIEEGYSPYKIKELINSINKENLGITWDVGHSNTTHFKMSEFFTCFKDNLLHMHFHYNNGPVNGWTDTHTEIGIGTIDWKGLFSFLREINYQRSIIFELNTNEKIENSLQYLKNFL